MSHPLVQQVTQDQLRTNLPDFSTGDQIRVWYRIVEQDRVRQAPFEGLVIRRRGSGVSETFTVRRVTFGEGVERVFLLHGPMVERIDVLRRGRVHRARLYFLRTKIGKTRIAAADTTKEAGSDTPITPSSSIEAATVSKPIETQTPAP